MIVLSSFRPFGEDREWDENQLRAFRSWLMFAERIYLFNEPDPMLKSNRVHFVQSEQYPRIRDMALFAAKHRRDTALICNGDIVINPEIKKIERKLGMTHACCASSRRWHFRPQSMMVDAIRNASLTNGDGIDDRGRDVFMAKASVWARVGVQLPDKYRIGNPQWDAALTNMFREHWDDKFLDFTAMRIVFHPIHAKRKYPYAEEIAATP